MSPYTFDQFRQALARLQHLYQSQTNHEEEVEQTKFDKLLKKSRTKTISKLAHPQAAPVVHFVDFLKFYFNDQVKYELYKEHEESVAGKNLLREAIERVYAVAADDEKRWKQVEEVVRSEVHQLRECFADPKINIVNFEMALAELAHLTRVNDNPRGNDPRLQGPRKFCNMVKSTLRNPRWYGRYHKYELSQGIPSDSQIIAMIETVSDMVAYSDTNLNVTLHNFDEASIELCGNCGITVHEPAPETAHSLSSHVNMGIRASRMYGINSRQLRRAWA